MRFFSPMMTFPLKYPGRCKWTYHHYPILGVCWLEPRILGVYQVASAFEANTRLAILSCSDSFT